MSTAAFVNYVILQIPSISGTSSFAGIFKGLTGLEVNFDVLEYREGGNNDFVHRLPGRITYPNLVLSWGMVNDQTLLKWFMLTQTQAQLQEITLTLATTKGNSQNDGRTFTFVDAFPVRWSGPQLMSDTVDPRTWHETLEIAHSGLKPQS